MDFNEFWKRSVEFLNANIAKSEDNRFIIHNWRVDKDDLPEIFPVIEVNDDEIFCLSIHASKKISLVKEDMEALYEIEVKGFPAIIASVNGKTIFSGE